MFTLINDPLRASRSADNSGRNYTRLFSGHSLSTEEPIDSRSRLPGASGFVARRIHAMHSGRARSVAQRRDALAIRAEDPHRLRRLALRTTDSPVDPEQLHSAADDGSGSLLL